MQFILAAEGTDNPQHVKDIILALTADADNLTKISKDYADFTNAKSVMEAAAKDDSFASAFLGGQNPYTYFHKSCTGSYLPAGLVKK